MKHLTEKGKNQAGIIAGVSSIGISLVGFLVSLVRLAFYGNDNNGVIALRVSNETAYTRDRASRTNFRRTSHFLLIVSGVFLALGIALTIIFSIRNFLLRKSRTK